MPKPPQAFWAGKWKAEAAGTASCPLGSPFGRAVTAGDLRGQRGLVTLSGGWRRQLPQRGSQGAGMPPRAIRYGLHPTNCWPARPRTSCRIFVGDDVEGSYESGEPNGVTIVAGLSGSHCQRRHAARPFRLASSAATHRRRKKMLPLFAAARSRGLQGSDLSDAVRNVLSAATRRTLRWMQKAATNRVSPMA